MRIKKQIFYVWIFLVLILSWDLIIGAPEHAKYLAIIFGIGIIVNSMRILIIERRFFWSPLFWFFLASGMWVGIGSGYLMFSDEEAKLFIMRNYIVEDSVIRSVFRFNVICILIMVTTYILCTSLRLGDKIQMPSIAKEIEYKYILCAIILGVGFKVLGFVIVKIFGVDVVMPGVVYGLEVFGLAAMFMLSYKYFSGDKSFLPLLLIVTSVQLYLALHSLMKQEILEAGFMFFAGYYLARPNPKLVCYSAIIVIPLYSLIIEPLTSFGRDFTGFERDRKFQVGEVAAAFLQKEDMSRWSVVKYAALSRFSQTSLQAFAMSEYNEGRPGQTFEAIPWVPFPRLLFPEKPILTSGDEFSLLIFIDRKRESFGMGPGYLAEAYWNGGWLYAVMVSMIIGIFMSIVENINYINMEKKSLLYIPTFYFLWRASWGLDKWFVLSFIGSIWFAFCFLLLCVLLCIIIDRKNRIVWSRNLRSHLS